MKKIDRRGMFKETGRLAGTIALGTSLADVVTQGAQAPDPGRKMKVVVAGAHPDDPESGCGGTMALFSSLGHEVVALYLTRGEAGIPGKTHQEAATIRTAEVKKACEILKARPVFAGQIDADTIVDREHYAHFKKILDAENPDLVFTQWPIDTHPDHRATSLLTYGAWLDGGRKFALYYYSVDLGLQTQTYEPRQYVNIASTEARKRAACFAHASQDPANTFWPVHARMQAFRGMECGCEYAEAFFRHVQSKEVMLPSFCPS